MPEKYLTSKIIKLVVIVAVCSLLIFLNPRGIFSPIRSVFSAVIYPLQKTSYILSRETREIFDFLSSISDLKKENERLLKENNSLAAREAEAENDRRENQILREQLGLLPKDKFDLEGSFVIGQDPQKFGSWIAIDKGSSSGIESGMPVIVSDGILVGRVDEVSSSSSRVNLLTSPSSSIGVIDLETGAKGIVKGEFGLGAIMDMVSQMDVLNEGDNVVTSGLGGDVPSGLLIGRIRAVKSTDDKLFQQAIISPRLKYSDLEAVFIIKKQK